ncbi:MAG: DUF4249 family protein [Gemmatimonadales bacterium]
MRTRLGSLVAIVGAAIASGCASQLPLEGGASTLVVSAVLDALHDDQIVAVQRTYGGRPAPTPVDSATVTITGPDGVVMTGVEAADSTIGRSYRVTLSAFHEQLVPGATYLLHVKLTTGEQVTGSTTIPDAQPASAPAVTQPFNAATDTLRLSWPVVQGAASFEVRVQSAAGVYALFADTGAVLPGTLRSLEGKVAFAPGFDHQVTVAAVDANYDRYYRSSSDEFSGAAVQGNLTGAQGLFGSIVVVAWQSLRVTATGH